MASDRPAGPARPQLPRGWRRLLARLPIALYRAGLGPLFGGRLLLLHHVGRNSGLDRRVVLEVVAYDRERGSRPLASGFGPQSAWYQNLRRTPTTTVQVGRRRHRVTAHFLSADEGGEVMARYTPRHPRTARRLCAFMGFDVDGSMASYRDAGRHIPFVRLDSSPGRG
ncbi:nitroreductase family deazaflavin-dependent oxidoreductase [Streptomyces sp. B-S-A8]|uniref:Nitroreductase family deazaflavin-dependent oxidoreductase n=1 Tax=Streptomyces solicavernae TaxID=3043614 RepID=A0ABT6RTF0_9ACTN|nr:nitroreductase family deazaflavin-dependent oxidoreductase [Streptomyces sp. B-S-A8]MDI3387707.1 nitroreductase family deazaflavin-dependent oxidoreductase [Streptomyces sp. B-S-A8]